MANPYGDGHASEKIVQVLTTVPLTPELLVKRHTPLIEDRLIAQPERVAHENSSLRS